jgi:hypothetical protein
MAITEKPMILFTVDFDGDPEAGDAPLRGWERFAALAFDAREDFRAVVNFRGAALERMSSDKAALGQVRDLVESGRIFIGNHSWDHPSFTGHYTGADPLDRAEQADQLIRAQEYIEATLGKPDFFRAPFFDHNEDTLQLIGQMGIRYDLSAHINEDKFAPLLPYIYLLPTYEKLVRIDTNLKLSPLGWVEPIKAWSGDELAPGLYNIITHPTEFVEPEQADEMMRRMELLMKAEVEFIGPDEIEGMLGM